MFTVANRAVNKLVFFKGIVLVKGNERVQVEIRGIWESSVTTFSDNFIRIPVVCNFVVIPSSIARDFFEKVCHVFVAVVVLPVCTELVESYGSEVLAWVIDPNATPKILRDFFFGRNVVVGINHIT